MTRGTFLPAPYLDEYGEADKVTFFTSFHILLRLFVVFFVLLYLHEYGEEDKVNVSTIGFVPHQSLASSRPKQLIYLAR